MRPGDAAAGDSSSDAADLDAPELDGQGSDAFMMDGAAVDASMPDAPSVDGAPDAPPMDAGPDAPMVDAGTDTGDAGCVGDAECSNSNACDGIETCVAGVCRPGTPVTCSDSVSCTRDTCNPATGACVFTPDSTMCAGSLVCTATGCVDPGCGESPCRLVSPQCGCPASQACYLAGDSSRVCAVEGSAAEGESCADDICSAGNICIDINGAGTVTSCRHFCDTDAQCTGGPGSICLVTVEGTMQRICTISCNPVTSAGCSAGTRCGLFTEAGTGRRLTDCETAGSGTQNAACTSTGNDCAPGFDCINTGSTNVCLKTCTRSPAGGECSAFPGTSCVRLGMDGLVFNGVEYGACF